MLEQGNFSYGGGAALDDLKAYVIAKLLWNPDLDVHELVHEFTDGVYGLAGKFMREYIYKISDGVCREIPLGIYDFPDAEYFSDELIAECAEIFDRAEESAESDLVRERVRRERLSIEFLMVARIENDEERAVAVDAFKQKLQHFRITEIRERRNLYETLEHMKKGRYAPFLTKDYYLYYIMR